MRDVMSANSVWHQSNNWPPGAQVKYVRIMLLYVKLTETLVLTKDWH